MGQKIREGLVSIIKYDDWITIPIEEKLDLSSLYRFTNLKRLDVDYVISAKDIKGLHLESIRAYFDDPAEAAEILDNPADSRELYGRYVFV